MADQDRDDDDGRGERRTAMTRAVPQPRSPDRVIELRQYTLKPGSRDTLIDLFDRKLVQPQEDAGMHVVGQFRDLDNPDRFVWLRSFADMPARERALAAFYGGPAWQASREAANATMVDSGNVLLLRPARPSTGFPVARSPRPAAGAAQRPSSLVTATLCHLPGPVDEQFIRLVEDDVLPAVVGAGADPSALLETEAASNTFPILPVREGEHVLAWFCVFADREHHQDYLDRLARSRDWRDRALPRLMTRVITAPDQLRLAPTARSALR
jgi:quinol monooxygenase YgiN